MNTPPSAWPVEVVRTHCAHCGAGVRGDFCDACGYRRGGPDADLVPDDPNGLGIASHIGTRFALFKDALINSELSSHRRVQLLKEVMTGKCGLSPQVFSEALHFARTLCGRHEAGRRELVLAICAALYVLGRLRGAPWPARALYVLRVPLKRVSECVFRAYCTKRVSAAVSGLSYLAAHYGGQPTVQYALLHREGFAEHSRAVFARAVPAPNEGDTERMALMGGLLFELMAILGLGAVLHQAEFEVGLPCFVMETVSWDGRPPPAALRACLAKGSEFTDAALTTIVSKMKEFLLRVYSHMKDGTLIVNALRKWHKHFLLDVPGLCEGALRSVLVAANGSPEKFSSLCHDLLPHVEFYLPSEQRSEWRSKKKKRIKLDLKWDALMEQSPEFDPGSIDNYLAEFAGVADDEAAQWAKLHCYTAQEKAHRSKYQARVDSLADGNELFSDETLSGSEGESSLD